MPIIVSPSSGAAASPQAGLSSVTFPLQMPLLPSPSAVKMTRHSTVAEVRGAFDGRRQVQEWAAEWWQAEITLPPMTQLNARAWCAFLAALRGKFGTFLLGDNSLKAPQGHGVGAGAPLVNGANQTGRTLVTDGWDPSQLVLRSGDWLQLGSGATQRLHMNLTDVNSDAGGNATLNVWPSLRESPADNAALVLSNCQGCFALDANDSDFSVDVARHYGISFKAVEAI